MAGACKPICRRNTPTSAVARSRGAAGEASVPASPFAGTGKHHHHAMQRRARRGGCNASCQARAPVSEAEGLCVRRGVRTGTSTDNTPYLEASVLARGLLVEDVVPSRLLARGAHNAHGPLGTQCECTSPSKAASKPRIYADAARSESHSGELRLAPVTRTKFWMAERGMRLTPLTRAWAPHKAVAEDSGTSGASRPHGPNITSLPPSGRRMGVEIEGTPYHECANHRTVLMLPSGFSRLFLQLLFNPGGALCLGDYPCHSILQAPGHLSHPEFAALDFNLFRSSRTASLIRLHQSSVIGPS
ncbi:hypothetical protein BU16DRAFT_534361 [Lophium mytilinum]|uniref:Uncharacterized protein n=1 Tax=Lophium mytilinum TaxID=390894 RepID=A0A6A6RA64_9PEZI|nr:hypothetical protein BU16DRAFT_534361 [Lophium mytilinum]